MKRFSIMTLAIAAMLIAIVGCSQEDKIVGTDALSAWVVDNVNGQQTACVTLYAGPGYQRFAGSSRDRRAGHTPGQEYDGRDALPAPT